MGEVVGRDVADAVGDSSIDVGQRLRQRLLRQRVHQVQVHVIEMRQRDLYRTARFVAVVDAAQRFEVAGVKALDTDGQAVDTRLAVTGKAFQFEGAGVGLHGDFGVRVDARAGAQAGQERVHRLRAEQAGGCRHP